MKSVTWSPGMSLASMEKLVILEAYQFYRSNKTQTATALGIAIRTLDSKLEQYDLDEQKEKERYDHDARKRIDELNRARGTFPQNLGITPIDYPSAKPGARMESLTHAAPQPEMPLPERTQVQTVLSPKSSGNSHAKRR